VKEKKQEIYRIDRVRCREAAQQSLDEEGADSQEDKRVKGVYRELRRFSSNKCWERW
jgi:hypothetical protein